MGSIPNRAPPEGEQQGGSTPHSGGVWWAAGILGRNVVDILCFIFLTRMFVWMISDVMGIVWTVRGGRERHTSHSKMRMSVGHSVTPVAVH